MAQVLLIAFPVTIGYGSVQLGAHLLCEVLAFTLGYRYYLWLRRGTQDPISGEHRTWIVLGAALGAFVGSRLVGALEDPHALAQADYLLLQVFASKTIVGGLLGGLLAVEGTKRLIGERASSGDLFTFPLILGMMIGRVGCFLTGVYEPTFGLPTDLPWGMNLGDGIARHPTALYEILFLALLWAGLRWISKRVPLRSGYLFQFFMIAYLLFRLWLDTIKPGYRHTIGLSTIQIVCLLGIAYYSHTLWFLITHPQKLLQHESPP